ncbi:hypothetical protein D3C75_849960 [compost metagenome]
MQVEYPQTIEYIVITSDNRIMQWPAFDDDSLIRSLHFYGHAAKRIMTLEEYEAKQNGVTQERELKESA